MSAPRLVLLIDISNGRGEADPADGGEPREEPGDELAAALGRLYEGESLEIEATPGHIRAVLAPTADPFRGLATAVLLTRPSAVCAQIEWLAAATEPAVAADAAGDRVAVSTGDAGADSLLADLMPLLVDQLESLTLRQREIARLALVDSLRQSEVAQRLGVARATVSISFDRAHVASLRRLLRAMRRIAEAGWTRAQAERGSDEES